MKFFILGELGGRGINFFMEQLSNDIKYNIQTFNPICSCQFARIKYIMLIRLIITPIYFAKNALLL